MTATLLHGDCRDVLPTLPAASVQCVVTSPPYFGLRDYGVAGQIGLEATPAEYVAALVDVFREVRRVLRPDGTLWLNLGDSYSGSSMTGGTESKEGSPKRAERMFKSASRTASLHPKNLIGIPWRVAFALQDDGWILRSDIVWHKTNCMPESVIDRPTRSHEYLFLFAKSPRYYYNQDAIREPHHSAPHPVGQNALRGQRAIRERGSLASATEQGWHPNGRNKRTVWDVPTRAFSGAHFAVMPEALVEPCILAGSKPGDVILDPFGGSGTVGRVATKHQRDSVLIELNPDYIALQERRTDGVQTMLEAV